MFNLVTPVHNTDAATQSILTGCTGPSRSTMYIGICTCLNTTQMSYSYTVYDYSISRYTSIDRTPSRAVEKTKRTTPANFHVPSRSDDSVYTSYYTMEPSCHVVDSIARRLMWVHTQLHQVHTMWYTRVRVCVPLREYIPYDMVFMVHTTLRTLITVDILTDDTHLRQQTATSQMPR